jgi:dolichol-phosphate mannosyltransferase
MFPELSIVVAVYNEDPRSLLMLLERLWTVLSPEHPSYEVVFVNDGSNLETTRAMRQIASEVDYVKLIELSRNFGQQSAIAAGFDHAEGQAIVYMDGDLQDPPEVIPAMIKYWRAGYQVVYAQRSTRKDGPMKRLTAYLFYRILGSVSQVRIPPDTGDFRLVDRKVVNEFRRLSETTRFLRCHTAWLGFRQIGIPIDREARVLGTTNYTLRKMFSLAMDGLTMFSVAPLLVIPAIGCFMLVIAAAFGAVGFVPHFQLHLDNTSIVAILIGVVGIQTVCLGVVSVYLSKVVEEVRRRPTYIVSERRGLGFTHTRHDSNRAAITNAQLKT